MQESNTRLPGLVAALVLLQLSASAQTTKQPVEPASSVLLELFTSEGCSSCPPADALLSNWAAQGSVSGVPVICLGFHVDYWNDLGWKDAWSSSTFTDRQSTYNRALHSASNYTPQLVVDGAAHVVGSRDQEAQQLVKAAAAGPHASLTLSQLPTATDPQAEVAIGALPGTGAQQQATLYAADVIDRTGSDVKRGENSGRKLQHSNVVAELSPVATVTLTSAATRVKIPLPKSVAAANHHLVLFLQDPMNHHILGATQVRLPQ